MAVAAINWPRPYWCYRHPNAACVSAHHLRCPQRELVLAPLHRRDSDGASHHVPFAAEPFAADLLLPSHWLIASCLDPLPPLAAGRALRLPVSFRSVSSPSDIPAAYAAVPMVLSALTTAGFANPSQDCTSSRCSQTPTFEPTSSPRTGVLLPAPAAALLPPRTGVLLPAPAAGASVLCLRPRPALPAGPAIDSRHVRKPAALVLSLACCLQFHALQQPVRRWRVQVVRDDAGCVHCRLDYHWCPRHTGEWSDPHTTVPMLAMAPSLTRSKWVGTANDLGPRG